MKLSPESVCAMTNYLILVDPGNRLPAEKKVEYVIIGASRVVPVRQNLEKISRACIGNGIQR